MKQHEAALAKIGLSLTEVRRNVRSVYAERTPEFHALGLSWYDDAMALGQEIAGVCGVSLEHAAVMIAHLSPRCRWSENVRLARQLAMTGTATGTIHKHVDRARLALTASDPWTTFGKAPKTRSFAGNIAGNLSCVTVDVWASRVAGITEQQLGRVGVYEAVAHAYRLEAKRAGILPAQLQAITWITIRGNAA